MRPHLPATLFLISSLLPGTGNDELTLDNGDLFVGEVVALQDGLIQIESPHGLEPLSIPNGNLAELNFGLPPDATQDQGDLPKDPQELVLHNGDRFPGELIALDEATITFRTWFTGDLTIPRKEVESVFFGVTPQELVYRGPNNLQEWDLDNRGSWRFQGDSLQSTQQSTIGKNLDLPESFIFKTTIGWQSNPDAYLYLCCDDVSPISKNPGDCYRIHLDSNSVKLHRCYQGGEDENEPDQLLEANVDLARGNSNSLDLELRIDRKSRTLDLYLDGTRVRRGIDPNTPPTGTALAFESRNRINGYLAVSDLTVSKWDAVTQKLRMEPMADSSLDTLVVNEGDRFSGTVRSYDPTEGDEAFLIKIEVSPDPLRIPLRHCAILYFDREEKIPPSEGSYAINLRVGGQLTLSRIKLNPESLSATHPWLGELKIDRRAMKSITKSE